MSFDIRQTVALLGALSLLMPGSVMAQETDPPPDTVDRVAPPSSDYARYIAEALSEFDAGNYEEALTLFQRAYDVNPNARVLRGIGKSQFELRAYTDAIASLEAAMAAEGEPLSETLRADVEALLLRARNFVAWLEVDVQPADARIALNGRLQPEGEIRFMLNSGAWELTVRAPGHVDHTEVVDLPGGTERRRTIHLEERTAERQIVERQTIVHREDSAVLPILSGATALVAAGSLVGSLLWHLNRASAFSDCEDAAQGGVPCTNGAAITDQRNTSLVMTIGSSILLAVSATVFAIALGASSGGDSSESETAAFDGVVRW